MPETAAGKVTVPQCGLKGRNLRCQGLPIAPDVHICQQFILARKKEEME